MPAPSGRQILRARNCQPVREAACQRLSLCVKQLVFFFFFVVLMDQNVSPRRRGEPAKRRRSARDEQRDALEQWLRRHVCSDPSGLYGANFSVETNDRLRSGVPDPRDQERIW